MPDPHPKPLAVIHPHAAGIDVHSDTHVVCTGPGQVRSFGAYTADLRDLADHVRRAGVTAVALESTGVYWIPLFDLLEAEGFDVKLVEPGQLSSCGARPKTDVLDCQWIQRLHSYGLLRGSFRPPAAVRALRTYHRLRQMVVRGAAGHVQHLQKALEQMNVKLTEVLSDITGVSGSKIVEAILAGERDPVALALLASPKCAKSRAEFALALAGTWQREHLFELRLAYELFRGYQTRLDDCDAKLAEELARLPAKSDTPLSPKARKRGRKKNDLRFEAAAPLHRALGIDLTAIEGIDAQTALVILAEIGVDVGAFATEKHFASWLGLCPQTAKSNKTEKRRRVRKGSNRVKQALRMCAQSLGRTQTPMGAFYRRIRSRIGGRGACTATAHKLARLVYRMLKHGAEYVAKGMAEYEAKQREQAERNLRKRARQLGYDLTPKAAPAPA